MSLQDPHLDSVLQRATNAQLSVIHDILMTKASETLSIEDDYRANYPDHAAYAYLMAKEVRDFGGNSIANVFRGEGPPYLECVCDVAKTIRAPFNKALPIEDIEASILGTLLARAFEAMSDDEKMVVLNELGKSSWVARKYMSALKDGSAIASHAILKLLQAISKADGFASQALMLIVVNSVVKGVIGRGLPWVANAALARVMGVATGPVGLSLAALWTLIEIAGPSYKVTVPSVVYIAWLRKSQSLVRCRDCDAVVDGGFRFCPTCGAEVPQS